MAGASILRDLSETDLDELHRMIRHDSKTDLAIARWAEERLGKPMGNDAAASRIVARYRASRPYQTWLKRWESQDVELAKSIRGQKDRLEYLKSLVQGGEKSGLYEVSKHLMARLLTIAAGMSDDDLASGDVKWIKGLLLEIREAEKLDRARLVEDLKDQLSALAGGGGASAKVDMAAVVAKVDQVMGIS